MAIPLDSSMSDEAFLAAAKAFYRQLFDYVGVDELTEPPLADMKDMGVANERYEELEAARTAHRQREVEPQERFNRQLLLLRSEFERRGLAPAETEAKYRTGVMHRLVRELVLADVASMIADLEARLAGGG